MKKSKIVTKIFSYFVTLCLLVSCGGQNSVPKPKGFFRIDLPEHQYKLLDSIYPYSFEYPIYTTIENDKMSPNEKSWSNVHFSDYNCDLHLSYKTIKNNLTIYTEDAYAMVMKHIAKASAINEVKVENDKNKVYGMVYILKGSETASPFQFYLTDSSKHFLRGALYFNVIPNNDSLSPLIEHFSKDIYHIIETLKWK